MGKEIKQNCHIIQKQRDIILEVKGELLKEKE